SSRTAVARCINALPKEIYFTSGGTEANNHAINTARFIGEKHGRKHVISTKFEHLSILNPLKSLEREGFEVSLLDINRDGFVCSGELERAIRSDTGFVSIIFANNEIGTIQPVEKIGAICRAHGAIFHTDAAAAVGYVLIDVASQNVDMLTLSAHKFHGPKGVGALYCKKDIVMPALIQGGAQERGKRGGTENIPAIAGMAIALSEACEGTHLTAELREKLVNGLLRIPGCFVNGSQSNHLPGIVNFCFADAARKLDAEAMIILLDMAGICASSGAACSSGSVDVSHVLLALGLTEEESRSSVRFSLSKYNTMDEIEKVVGVMKEILMD
ncbi:MAG: cysteine desulfurase, partial [Defluviitaleaceae bacterium]|nr:cysteine desulfurase [Defluviitaleaceae bacterium]